MSHRFTLGTLIALVALLTPTSAQAKTPAPARRAPTAQSPTTARSQALRARQAQSAATTKLRVTKDDGYSYAFGDDPLQAQGNDAGGAQIAVRQGHVRGLLIRPRIQFVDALLKSVENI